MEPKAICEQCGQEYWKAKDWQRFCQPKCRDGWHNHQRKIALVEMSGFRPTEELRQAATEALTKMRRAEIPDAPHPWRNRFSHKPLAEVMKSLKERTEPQQQPSLRRSWR
ncbi:MAG: hypothetical protein WA322_01815 [Pseudolabrys sp.]